MTRDEGEGVDVTSQTDVQLQEIPLIEEDPEALNLLRQLHDRGYTADQVAEAMQRLDPVPVTRVRQRQAARARLDQRIRTEVGRILAERGINPQGRDLDRQRRSRTNFVILKSAIDRRVNAIVGLGTGARSEFTQGQIDAVNAEFAGVIAQAVTEVFDA